MARLSIGEFLAKLRKEKSLTQQEVADRLDVSNRTVSAWEKDKAMPDVLLLPAIAELYGVSVDEILYGARKASEEDTPLFSPKTEKSLLRKKLSRFTMQSFILLGVSILGQIFLFMSWFNYAFADNSDGEFSWWLFLQYVSIVAIVVVFAVLIGLWKSCESSIDSSSEASKSFLLALFQRVVLHFYIAGAASIVFAYVLLRYFKAGLLTGHMCITYLVTSAVLVFVGVLMHNHKSSVLSDKDSHVKQLRSIMFYCFAAAASFAFAALIASNIDSSEYFERYVNAITYGCVIFSFAFLLTGTLLFNNKLSTNAKENAAFLAKMSCSMSVGCYVISGLYLIFGLLSLIDFLGNIINFVFVAIMFVLFLLSLLLGVLLHRRNLLLYSYGDEIRALFKRNGKLYLKVALWGLIPFAVSLIVGNVGYLVLGSIPVVFVGLAIFLLGIIGCFVICLVKREKPSFKQ